MVTASLIARIQLDLANSYVIGDRESDLQLAENMGIAGIRIGEGQPGWNEIAEQIIGRLREVEVRLSQGEKIGVICRGLGISEQSYYRWRREYGGLKVDQAKRLKDLEKENARLKRAVADLTLDKLILKEVAEGNF